MIHAYVLSEDDFDEQVYVYLLEMLLRERVEPIPVRLRRGGGVAEVRKKLPLMLDMIRRSGATADTCFVVGIDNDRAPVHPAHVKLPHTEKIPCRHCSLGESIAQGMPDGWTIPGAVAVPVQMIESWLLLLHDPTRFPRETDLPLCAWRDQSRARDLYGASPPPQLKDLVEDARSALPKDEFALACALKFEAENLAARSESFGRFRQEVARLVR